LTSDNIPLISLDRKDFTRIDIRAVKTEEEAHTILKLVLAEQAVQEASKRLADSRLAEAYARVEFFTLEAVKAWERLERVDVIVGELRSAMRKSGYSIYIEKTHSHVSEIDQSEL
jgi:hypothetical protein